jgi:SIR2-like protein
MRVVCPDDLRSLYLEGRLVPFIGAGISTAVTWTTDTGERQHGPSWGELVDKAAELLGFDDAQLLRARGTDLQILEYFRIKRHDNTGELTSWLTTHMQPGDADLAASPVHASLAAMDKCSVFYTTNYDDFLERAFRLHHRQAMPVTIEGHIADALTRRVSGEPPLCEIVKFHGDLLQTSEMVLSESDYERRLKLEKALDHRLRNDALGRAILFLGYSFRDWNVAYLFRLVNEAFGQLPGSVYGRRAYITVADPSDFERTLFKARNIEVIPVRGSHRTEDTAALLRQLLEPPLV